MVIAAHGASRHTAGSAAPTSWQQDRGGMRAILTTRTTRSAASYGGVSRPSRAALSTISTWGAKFGAQLRRQRALSGAFGRDKFNLNRYRQAMLESVGWTFQCRDELAHRLL